MMNHYENKDKEQTPEKPVSNEQTDNQSHRISDEIKNAHASGLGSIGGRNDDLSADSQQNTADDY